MKTILTLTMAFLLLSLISCGESKEDKAKRETQQKAREDSIIIAVEKATREKIAKEQAFHDSIIRAAKNNTPNIDYTNKNITIQGQKIDLATKDYIQAEENIRKQLEQMRKSMEQMQQLKTY